jgi:hypothetical protein
LEGVVVDCLSRTRSETSGYRTIDEAVAETCTRLRTWLAQQPAPTLTAAQHVAAVGERAECVAREQRWLARLAACEGERDAELKRRQFMQVYGRVMGWGFNSVEEMDAEGVAAAGVCVSDEREPYRSRKLVFVRYSEFGGDKARTEAEAIDRAIRITEELDTTDDFGPNDGHTRTGNRSAWQEGKV